MQYPKNVELTKAESREWWLPGAERKGEHVGQRVQVFIISQLYSLVTIVNALLNT